MFYLPDLAKQEPNTTIVTLNERLPAFLSPPCQLEVTYFVKKEDNYYIIDLHVKGQLTIICQRCLEEFNLAYDNHTNIAVCRHEDRAEQLLEHYECIVAPDWQFNLEELIIDELHLYLPQFHPEINDCNDDINEILLGKSKTY